VPAAPSFLALDDEETKAYDTRARPGVSLSALLAECQGSVEPIREVSVASTTIEKVPSRGASFHTVPHFPEDPNPVVSTESNLHQIEDDRIEDALVSGAPDVAPETWIKAWSSHPTDNVPSVQPPRPRSSRRRSMFTKFLFVMIAIAMGLLVASEFAAASGMPQLDPRPLLAKGVRLAKDKIPWDRIPRIPRH
jgi:hypothetical protein